MKGKSTKSALLMSFTSLLLCFAMLIGCTFAWFTDSVTSGVNKIIAGNLDVELYHAKGTVTADDSNKVSSDTELFKVDKWEPGVVAYENFLVKNVGTLALKYQLAMTVGDFNKTVEGNHTLKEVLKVAVVPGGFTGTTRADAQALTGYTTLEQFSTGSNGALLPGVAGDTFGVVIYWQPTDNDNLYNLNNGKKAVASNNFGETELGIELGIKLFATQLEHESDSFGPDYDRTATMESVYAAATQTVTETVKSGKDTVFTSFVTPSNEDGNTTKVTVPKEVASFVADSTSSMTVEATPIVAANNTFTVSSSNGAVGAIDLTVKVDDVVVDQFKDKGGEAIPVTVETYVAKGLTGVTLEYNNGTGVQPTDVTYDSATGKLSWKTTHFSTFVLGANEVAYVESNNTAYLTFAEAINAAQDDGDTITLLKDCGFTGTIRTVKNFTLDLNQKTLAMSSSGVLNYGYDSSNKKHPVTEVIKNGTITGTNSSDYIRFEDGSGCTFANVKFTYPSATSAQKILQTYATNKNNELTENKYTFTGCEFKNAWVSFEGSSSSTNNYQLSFTDCSFNATNGSHGTNLIAINAYDYGTLTLNNVNFTYASTGNSCYCVNVDTYLGYVNGQKFNVTLNNVTMNTSGTAYPYTYRFLTYNSGYSDNAVITETGTNTYKHNGKTVKMFIKETSATNKNVAWTENADAYKACLAEWVAYANAKPSDYDQNKYYLVECDGYYYIGGQGTQFNDNATVTKDGNTVTQVVVSGYFTTTYKKIGTTDISTQLGEADKTSVHIYTLARQ